MKISELIQQLEHIKQEHGDVPVQMQSGPVHPETSAGITDFESFFVVPEEYPDEGWIVNLRWWPY